MHPLHKPPVPRGAPVPSSSPQDHVDEHVAQERVALQLEVWRRGVSISSDLELRLLARYIMEQLLLEPRLLS